MLSPVAPWNDPLCANGKLAVYEFPLELVPIEPSFKK